MPLSLLILAHHRHCDFGTTTYTPTTLGLAIGRIQTFRTTCRTNRFGLRFMYKAKSDRTHAANFVIDPLAIIAIPTNLCITDSDRVDKNKFHHPFMFFLASPIIAADTGAQHVIRSKRARSVPTLAS